MIKAVTYVVLDLLVVVVVGVVCYSLGRGVAVPGGTDNVLRRDTVCVRETVKVVKPVAVREEVVRVVRVPVMDTVTVTDSVTLPITQKVYSDTTYTAWVSGVEPELDSIEVYPRTTFVRERVEVVKAGRRWSVGIQGGVGLTPKGVLPYVGVGVGVRLF